VAGYNVFGKRVFGLYPFILRELKELFVIQFNWEMIIEGSSEYFQD